MRRINEVSRICCRTIIFKVLLVSYFIAVFFVYNENIIYWIWIQQYYYSSQSCNKLQNLCSLGAAATSTTIVVDFYWF